MCIRDRNSFLPHFIEVNVIDDKANRQYLINLKSEDGKEFSSRVLSEGTLRLLTLCIIEFDDKHSGLICFEEPENGIHPFRIKAMAELLKDLSADFSEPKTLLRQVIVNTHSPVLVSELIQWQNDKNISVGLSHLKTSVIIVPIQMTESWMLAEKELLKKEIGTDKTDIELGIHRDPESTVSYTHLTLPTICSV